MMHCKCDNCGKEAPAVFNARWEKPVDWFEKKHLRVYMDEPRIIQVCSKECIIEMEEKIILFRIQKDRNKLQNPHNKN